MFSQSDKTGVPEAESGSVEGEQGPRKIWQEDSPDGNVNENAPMISPDDMTHFLSSMVSTVFNGFR